VSPDYAARRTRARQMNLQGIDIEIIAAETGISRAALERRLYRLIHRANPTNRLFALWTRPADGKRSALMNMRASL
jgi:hypothetical protein